MEKNLVNEVLKAGDLKWDIHHDPVLGSLGGFLTQLVLSFNGETYSTTGKF